MKFRTIFSLLLLGASLTASAQDSTAVAPKISVRHAQKGIIVIDSVTSARAFSPFGGTRRGAEAYAHMVNHYKRLVGDSVNVYCMTIPGASAFYWPEQIAAPTTPEQRGLDWLFSALSDSVTAVDVCNTLEAHKNEAIYLRTDHHWGPLGAYYAAGELARAAKVEFRPLSDYEPRTVHSFVGTMYKFSKDIAVKQHPEEFVYYVPSKTKFTSYFIDYTQVKGTKVWKGGESEERYYFRTYKDGSGLAYSTFMGGDSHTVRTVTECKNGRRLLILKDSYGNAVGSNLFYGFEEVHVIDFRYFPDNVLTYIRENGITDLVFINNLSLACAPSNTAKFERMLTR